MTIRILHSPRAMCIKLWVAKNHAGMVLHKNNSNERSYGKFLDGYFNIE